MPTDTILFLGLVLFAFGLFIATVVGADLFTRDVRGKNHPAPGE